MERQKVFYSLFDKLSELHSGVHQGEMARILFREESDTRHLVGILDDGQKAAFYDNTTYAIYAVPFDHHGIQTEKEELIWERYQTDGSWIEELEDKFYWVHPRYR